MHMNTNFNKELQCYSLLNHPGVIPMESSQVPGLTF